MKNMLRFAIAGLTLLAAAAVQGQQPAEASREIRVKPPKASPASTPEYDVRVKGGGSNSSPNSNWLEVEAEFDTAPAWTDEVTFSYYVLLKAKSKEDVGPAGRQYNLFRGEVTYVDVPKGRGWKSNMFLPPSTFRRYGDVEKVGMQVKLKGVIVSEESVPAAKSRWWEEHPVKGQLLPRNLTHVNVNPDANPTIRPAVAAPAN
ncbi:MAG: hypothetical protein U1F87_08130 [Kiritimatiellia bacterium]